MNIIELKKKKTKELRKKRYLFRNNKYLKKTI